ncbi:hypothetical protein JCM11641_005225 [Rhodosporidiobolus odoratus]
MTVLASFPPLLGYVPREHLAQGGQSTVYRALNPQLGEFAALKVVPLSITSQAEQAAVQAKAKQLVREMRIHETLQHRSILRLFGGETRDECECQIGADEKTTGGGEQKTSRRPRTMRWPAGLYMILDLAIGGDLFDKITPDVGIHEQVAHLYFKQLISGLKYLNHHGICHRDIKPENCLVDGGGNLKVSDFGLATVFKYKGQERLLKDRCGSPPYAAPELARPQPYAAEPIDVWSAGVVLFALLFGNTPWDEPTTAAPEFATYLRGPAFFMREHPWNKYSANSAVMQDLLRVLTVNPEERPRLSDIERGEWFRQPNDYLSPTTGLVIDPHRLSNDMLRALHAHSYVGPPASDFAEIMAISDMQVASQQPPSATQAAMSQKLTQHGLDPQQAFSSSMQLYSRLSMAPTQRNNPGMTRFFTAHPLPVLVSLLSRAFDSLSLPVPPAIAARNGKVYELLYSPTTSSSSSSATYDAVSAPPSIEDIRDASLGTVFARFRVITTDKRGQKLWVGVQISKSILPPEPSFRPPTSQRQQGMGMDLDSDSEDDDNLPGGQRREHEEEEQGQEGFDVVCLKREADPLEMKRVWRDLTGRLPEGVVLAT